MIKKILYIFLVIALLMSTMTMAISAKKADKDYVKPSYDKKWGTKNTHDNKWDNNKWDHNDNKWDYNKGKQDEKKWVTDYKPINYKCGWGHYDCYENHWDYNDCYENRWNWGYDDCSDKWGYDKSWNGLYWCDDCCKGFCKSDCKYVKNYMPVDYLKFPRIVGLGTAKVEGYFISFNCNGADSILPQYYTHGAFSSKPADPVRNGFKFGGWFVDENCKIKPYKFDCRVTYSFPLYASWIPV